MGNPEVVDCRFVEESSDQWRCRRRDDARHISICHPHHVFADRHITASRPQLERLKLPDHARRWPIDLMILRADSDLESTRP